MPKRPFDILRACFYLLAAVILIQLLATVAAGVMCWLTNIYGAKVVGACLPIDQVIRDIWAEILTAVLALLAARGSPPPPPPGHQDE